jgi:hypothetical protein
VRVNLKDWVSGEQGKHVCQCGCGQIIRIIKDHHARGIPQYVKGHSARVINGMKGRFAESNPHFKGGRWIDQHGYVVVLNPNRTCHRDRYIYEHRLVMQEHLGRQLEREEQIHHRNKIKTDNRIENLEILDVAEHARLHDAELRDLVGEETYLRAKRCIHKGISYREMIACS